MGAVSKKMHDIIDGTETTLSEEKRAEYDGLGEEYRALAETRIRMEQQAVTDNSAALRAALCFVCKSYV